MSKRTINGRFEVSLLFREDPNILGESNVNALKRLRYLKRTFQKDPQLQIQYISFMEYIKYIKLGYMSALLDTKDMNYLPHNARSLEGRININKTPSDPLTPPRRLENP